MKYLKQYEEKRSFEDEFYKPEMYYVSFAEDDPIPSEKHYKGKGFVPLFQDFDDCVTFSISLAKKLNKLNIEFKIYHEHDDPDSPEIYFLFKDKTNIPKYLESHEILMSYESYLRNWKVDEIPNNDIELYFVFIKYNL